MSSRQFGLIRRTGAAIRADALVRSSSLLIGDYLVVGLIGGICSVIAARAWSPHDIGALAGIVGALGLVITASTTGIASTITRFLARRRISGRSSWRRIRWRSLSA